jgi:hypothetical protein
VKGAGRGIPGHLLWLRGQGKASLNKEALGCHPKDEKEPALGRGRSRPREKHVRGLNTSHWKTTDVFYSP